MSAPTKPDGDTDADAAWDQDGEPTGTPVRRRPRVDGDPDGPSGHRDGEDAAGERADADGGTSATMAAKMGQELDEVETVDVRRRVLIGIPAFLVGLVIAELAKDAIGFSATTTLIQGVELGAIFALVSLGIALVYKATRVLNFAQGAFGSLPTFVALFLMLNFSVTIPEGTPVLDGVAAGADISFLEFVVWGAVAMVIGAVMAVGTNTFVVQRLQNASPATTLVATAAVALLVIGIQFVVFDTQLRTFPRPIDGDPSALHLPGGGCLLKFDPTADCADATLGIAGTPISWHLLVVLAVLGTAAALLAIFFRTPAGIALLGTAQEPFAAELYGVSVKTMSTVAWGAAGALGGVGGLLAAGYFQQAFPGYMTRDWVIPAFTGAVLGGITSMPGAVLGAVLLGVIASLANQVNTAYSLGLPSPPQLATLIVLIGVLIVRPRGLLGKEA